MKSSFVELLKRDPATVEECKALYMDLLLVYQSLTSQQQAGPMGKEIRCKQREVLKLQLQLQGDLYPQGLRDARSEMVYQIRKQLGLVK